MIPTIHVEERARFRAEFYEPERPVVLRGAQPTGMPSGSLARAIRARLRSEGSPRLLWCDAAPEALAGLCDPPPVVAELLDGDAITTRVRVWSSRAGRVTPWHYDGNSLHGFNLQLSGRKRWSLASPDARFLCLPFSNAAVFPCSRAAPLQLELAEGEMLFLPRYWFHRVESLGEVNLNVNWVMTPRRAAVQSRIARREAQLAWLRGRTPRSSFASSTARILQELALAPFTLPWLPAHARALLAHRAPGPDEAALGPA